MRRPYPYTGFVHDPSVLWMAGLGRTIENGLTALCCPQPFICWKRNAPSKKHITHSEMGIRQVAHKDIITTATEEALQAYKRTHLLALYPSLPPRQKFAASRSLDLTCFSLPSFSTKRTTPSVVISIAVPSSSKSHRMFSSISTAVGPLDIWTT